MSSEQNHNYPPKIQGTARYQYQPLNPLSFEIRLLILEPTASWSDEINCSLTIVDLENFPIFEALSYTWDAGVSTEPIMLSKTSFPITPNLDSFLRHRRSKTEAISLWIDAICINQSSNSEKSFQVSMMNKIYIAAKNMTIWLGPEADYSSLAMEAIKLHGAGSPYEKMPILTGSILTAVEKLLSRRWWSRIWIIQEVFWGGAGRKIQEMRVRCGTKEVWWVNFVLAAVRMQAHADYQRQYYPAIGSIIRLEELRDQCEFIAKSAANEEMVLDLVAMHRHFLATDPRDKIYALMGIVFSAGFKPYAGIKIDYSMDTKEVYEAFAILALQNGPGLEILRYCHSPAMAMLPSWVPDWSLSTVEKPLPCRKNSIYKNEPWWLKRSPKKDEGEESAFIEEGPGKGLKVNNGIPGEVQLNTLPKAFVEKSPPHILSAIKELMDSGRLVIASTNDPDEDEVISKDDPKQLDASEERLVRRGEIITRQTTESRIKALLAGPAVRYAAAGETKSKIAIRNATKTLEIEGVLFDVIDQIHEPFVDHVDSNWENSTHFMVAVGQCKQLALLDYRGQNPYSSLKAREEAFWLTLFAGGQIMKNSEEISIDKMPFHEWLPLIPTPWIPSSPQVTVVNTGRLKAAEDFKVAGPVMTKEFRKTSPTVKEEHFKLDMPAVKMLANLQPEEWTDEDRHYYTTRFQQLGSMWHQQPFDLYHRPFALPTVIPDPFGDTRQIEDELALSRSKTRKFEGMLSFVDSTDADGNRWNPRPCIEAALQKVVPIVPICTLDPGSENYALGRRFFVTRKGYLGLGPRDAKIGDRVSVMLGSDVPFIIRKREIASGGGGWKMVGETYVHGIMKGEVIDKWKMGSVEVGRLVLP